MLVWRDVIYGLLAPVAFLGVSRMYCKWKSQWKWTLLFSLFYRQCCSGPAPALIKIVGRVPICSSLSRMKALFPNLQVQLSSVWCRAWGREGDRVSICPYCFPLSMFPEMGCVRQRCRARFSSCLSPRNSPHQPIRPYNATGQRLRLLHQYHSLCHVTLTDDHFISQGSCLITNQTKRIDFFRKIPGVFPTGPLFMNPLVTWWFLLFRRHHLTLDNLHIALPWTAGHTQNRSGFFSFRLPRHPYKYFTSDARLCYMDTFSSLCQLILWHLVMECISRGQ